MNRLLFSFSISLTAVLLSACGGKSGKADHSEPSATVTVCTDSVGERAFGNTLTVSGNIEGWRTVKQAFMVAGQIDYILAAEGSYVKKGTLVARIEPTYYELGKSLTDVQVAQAEDEYQRLKLMYDRKSISESDFNKCRFALRGARTQQKLRQQELTDTRLHASLSGVVLKKLAEQGEVVDKGYPVIVISDISRVKANAYIPEDRLADVHIGQKASVRISAIGKTAEGVVREVGGVADPTTRAFTVSVEVSNPSLAIRPGMIAEVSLPASGTALRLVVPTAAILHAADGTPYIYVVDQQKQQAFKRTVSLGEVADRFTEIVSGVKQGEIIVSSGQQKLVNGSHIKQATKH